MHVKDPLYFSGTHTCSCRTELQNTIFWLCTHTKKGNSQLYSITWALPDVRCLQWQYTHLGQQGFKTGSSDCFPQNQSQRSRDCERRLRSREEPASKVVLGFPNPNGTAGLQHQTSDLQETSQTFTCNWQRLMKKCCSWGTAQLDKDLHICRS